jgi:hypothetical protein
MCVWVIGTDIDIVSARAVAKGEAPMAKSEAKTIAVLRMFMVSSLGSFCGFGTDRPYLHVRYVPVEVTDAEKIIL